MKTRNVALASSPNKGKIAREYSSLQPNCVLVELEKRNSREMISGEFEFNVVNWENAKKRFYPILTDSAMKRQSRLNCPLSLRLRCDLVAKSPNPVQKLFYVRSVCRLAASWGASPHCLIKGIQEFRSVRVVAAITRKNLFSLIMKLFAPARV